MAQTREELAALGVEWPSTEDELPCDDGMPMETQRHVMQLQLLMDPLRTYWAERQDVYVGGNMFVYFTLEQVRNQDFRGPDFFAVLDVPKRERKSWVVWQEGKGPVLRCTTGSMSRSRRMPEGGCAARSWDWRWYAGKAATICFRGIAFARPHT